MNSFHFDRSRRVRGWAIAAIAALAACSGGQTGPTGSLLPDSGTTSAAAARGGAEPDNTATMYVVSFPSNEILGFPTNADGNVTPSVKIAGSKTKLSGPSALAVDPASGKIYAANGYPDGRILIFPKDANGNVAPKVLAGSNVPVHNPAGLAVDSNGNLYVSDYLAKTIYVFAAGAAGNAAPIRTIAGSNTQLSQPSGLSFDSSGHLYVTNIRDTVAPIEEFGAGANGNVAPIATIGGSHTGIGGLYNVSLDRNDRIVAAYGDRIKIFAAGAHGNVAPVAVIKGSATKLVDATTAGTGAGSTIYVTNIIDVQHLKSSILAFASNADGNVGPLRQIAGSHADVFDTWFPSIL